MKNKCVQYYVEGDDEKKLVEVLKTDLRVIAPGKVQKFNAVEQELTDLRLRTLKPNTTVVLIFDTDTGSIDTLLKNIQTLERCKSVSEIVLIPQVQNLENELVRSCNIKKAEELLNSTSRGHFKHDLIHVSNLASKLREHEFDINLFWSGRPSAPYDQLGNQAAKIKTV